MKFVLKNLLLFSRKQEHTMEFASSKREKLYFSNLRCRFIDYDNLDNYIDPP